MTTKKAAPKKTATARKLAAKKPASTKAEPVALPPVADTPTVSMLIEKANQNNDKLLALHTQLNTILNECTGNEPVAIDKGMFEQSAAGHLNNMNLRLSNTEALIDSISNLATKLRATL